MGGAQRRDGWTICHNIRAMGHRLSLRAASIFRVPPLAAPRHHANFCFKSRNDCPPWTPCAFSPMSRASEQQLLVEWSNDECNEAAQPDQRQARKSVSDRAIFFEIAGNENSSLGPTCGSRG